jgi:hypothetical protein
LEIPVFEWTECVLVSFGYCVSFVVGFHSRVVICEVILQGKSHSSAHTVSPTELRIAAEHKRMSLPSTTRELIQVAVEEGEYSQEQADVLAEIWADIKVISIAVLACCDFVSPVTLTLVIYAAFTDG